MFQTWSCLHVLYRLLSVWKCRCVQRPLFCRCLWWSATVTSTVFMMITTCMREYQRHFCSVIKDLLSSGNRNSVRGPAVTRELFSLQKFIWPSVQIPVLQSHWCEWSRSSSLDVCLPLLAGRVITLLGCFHCTSSSLLGLFFVINEKVVF